MTDADAGRPRTGPMPPPPRRRRRRPILRFLLVVSILGVLVVAAGVFLLGPPVVVSSGTWIEVVFSPEHPDQRRDPRGFSAAFEAPVLSQQELLAALDRARLDPRIDGVLIRAEGFAGGWAQAREIRGALDACRDAGKRVIAHARSTTPIDYYIAGRSDRFVLTPEGLVWIGGLQAELLFLRGALDKIGVEFEAVGVGEYKSAPEQLTAGEASRQNREQVNAYLDDVYGEWSTAIAVDRGLTHERMTMLVDRGLHDPPLALAAGLVDELKTYDDLLNELGVDGRSSRLDPVTYLEAAGTAESTATDVRIAVVHVTGTITPGRSSSGGVGGAVAGAETILRRIEAAHEDDRVRAVVLRVDSPGGSAMASEIILARLDRLAADKPLVVSMGPTAASGGYYVAMNADRIVADPLTLTGSIGVFALRPNLAGTYDELDVNVEVFRRGENAGLFGTTRPWTVSQRAVLQEALDRFYTRFVENVAAGRGMPVARADSVARGRVWSGVRAREVGLVDRLGSRADAIALAAELAGIDPAVRPAVVTFQPEPGFLDGMLAEWLSDERQVRMPAWIESAFGVADRLGGVAAVADGHALFLLPWTLSLR